MLMRRLLQCSILLLFAAMQVHALNAKKLFHELSPSVVVIKAYQAKNGNKANLGSGVLISEKGEILTASHVVQTANRVVVKFLTGEVIPAKVVASEPYADVAMLQLTRMPKRFRVAPLISSRYTKIGEEIMVLGAPYGLSYSLAVGHITSKRRGQHVRGNMTMAELFQTDATINKGNSGGPMFDSDGKLIGIVSHILSKSGGHEGVGFAVTSETVRKLLIEQNSLWTGVSGYLLTGELAKAFNLPQPNGFLVQHVADNSLGQRLGLRAGSMNSMVEDDGKKVPLMLGGDVVLAVMGMPINENDYVTLQERMASIKVGGRISVTVLRGGKRLTFTTTRQR